MDERNEIRLFADILFPLAINIFVFCLSYWIASNDESLGGEGIVVFLIAFLFYGTAVAIHKFGIRLLTVLNPFNAFFGFFYFIYQIFKRFFLFLKYIRQQIIKRKRRKALEEYRKNPIKIKSYSLEEYLEKILTIDD